MKRVDITEPQPAPFARAGAPSMHDVAAALHLDRRDHGLGKYGSLLQTHNGRNALVDRVQESLDHLVYEIQDLIERQALRAALVEFHGYLESVSDDQADPSVRRALGEVLEQFEDLTDRDALASRADAIAAGLIGDAR